MFCGKCGQEVADGVAFCPNCGAPMTSTANTEQQAAAPVANGNMGTAGSNQDNNMILIGLILGIASIALGVLGGIMFGIFGALFGCAAGVAGLLLGINIKKTGDSKKGNAGFICSIVGLALSVVFFAGCGMCGICERSSVGTKGYTCYGCIGGRCVAAQDVNRAINDLNSYFNSFDW